LGGPVAATAGVDNPKVQIQATPANNRVATIERRQQQVGVCEFIVGSNNL
jgi:hypothetical protein